jgi:hypothetical protein
MSKVDVLAEHHRARAGYHADLMVSAVLDGVRRDARAFAHGLMHPHPADAGFAAVVHDALGDFGPRDDDDPVHAARNRLQVGITPIAFEGLHVWVHREHVVSRVLQPVVDQVSDWVIAVVAGHAGDSDAFLSQEVLHLRFKNHDASAARQQVRCREIEQQVRHVFEELPGACGIFPLLLSKISYATELTAWAPKTTT